MTSNQLTYWTLEETKRSNKARERENNRTNLANEAIKRRTNDINLSLGTRNADENYRTHTVNELENQRSHMANEDLQRYKLGQGDRELQLKALSYTVDLANAESNRMNAQSNRMNAVTNSNQLLETNRSNLANEQIKRDQLQETNRSNIASENIRRFEAASNAGVKGTSNTLDQQRIAETQRHDVVTENETKRKNLTDQYLKSLELQHRINVDTAKTNADIWSVGNQTLSTVVGRGGLLNAAK